jgi:glycosyltransferase involved in cell wall biosynthesis
MRRIGARPRARAIDGSEDVDGSIDMRPSADLVLHVCTRYQRGGSERRVRDSIRALPEFRHHLLLGQDSDLALAREQTGAERVEVLPTLVREVAPAQDLAALRTLRRLLRSREHALVISHQSKAGVLVRATAPGDLPVVHSLSMASFGAGYGRLENVVFPRLERALAARTAAYCVVGDDLARRFAEIGVPGDRLHVVRSGVPLPEQLPERTEARRVLDARLGTVPGRPLIAYVGSLEPRKNPLSLARLLRLLHDRLGAEAPDLLVVGDGPLAGDLAAYLRALRIDEHAVLAGYVADPTLVHRVMRGVDVVLLLSDTEGLPQVLVQSAAAGTPFVAFDVEGVAEILALGARGSAVPIGRLDLVGDAVSGWLSAVHDREPVADLSSWTPELIAASYRAVADRVLRRSPVVAAAADRSLLPVA